MIEQIENFAIIGIQVRTSNANQRAAKDIGELWSKLYKEGIADQISNKLSPEIYAVYSDYESNHTGEYTVTLGFKVSSLENIPTDLFGKTIAKGTYTPFLAKGAMPMAVIQTWQEIWSKESELNRVYSTDFEVYGNRATQGDQSEVDIFIGIN